MESRIVLYAFVTSPFAAKVKAYLDYKRLPFEMVYVDPLTASEIAFTRQRRIPVLKIDDEWRRGSSSIGEWLDERFPARPLLGASPDERARILELDEWVTAAVIPAAFRLVAEWDSLASGLRNGWRLSAALHSTKPLPVWARFAWPFLIRRAAFVRRIVRRQRARYGHEERDKMWRRIFNEFGERLGGGPFLGERATLSLADLSAYSQFVFPRLLGMRAGGGASRPQPSLAFARWMARMSRELPANPSLLPDAFIGQGAPPERLSG